MTRLTTLISTLLPVIVIVLGVRYVFDESPESTEVGSVQDAQFEQDVLHSPQPVLVDFCATWCGPCRAQGPILDQVARTTDRVRFVRIDVDQHRDLARQFHITGIPCLILFQDGRIRARRVGLQSKEAVEALVGL